MKIITIYKKQTGLVSRIYSGIDPEIQAGPDEDYIEGSFDGATYYIKNGQPKPYPEKPDNPFIIFDYTSETWTDPRTEEDRLSYQILQNRIRRKKELNESDWVVTRAVDTGTPVPPEWQSYRQQLRDITNQSDPYNIIWPQKPT